MRNRTETVQRRIRHTEKSKITSTPLLPSFWDSNREDWWVVARLQHTGHGSKQNTGEKSRAQIKFTRDTWSTTICPNRPQLSGGWATTVGGCPCTSWHSHAQWCVAQTAG